MGLAAANVRMGFGLAPVPRRRLRPCAGRRQLDGCLLGQAHDFRERHALGVTSIILAQPRLLVPLHSDYDSLAVSG